jgi:hypothetical protein
MHRVAAPRGAARVWILQHNNSTNVQQGKKVKKVGEKFDLIWSKIVSDISLSHRRSILIRHCQTVLAPRVSANAREELTVYLLENIRHTCFRAEPSTVLRSQRFFSDDSITTTRALARTRAAPKSVGPRAPLGATAEGNSSCARGMWGRRVRRYD